MTMDIPSYRATRDIDFLAITSNDLEEIRNLITQICRVKASPDGLHFDTRTIICRPITEDSEYHGVRVRFKTFMDRSRIDMQIDLGIGDVIHPKPVSISLRSILNNSHVVKLKGYTTESVIAEKLQAMANLGLVNSRIKDFFYIWFLSRNFDFEGNRLGTAIEKTFERRKTEIPTAFESFLRDYSQDPVNQSRWAAFLTRLDLKSVPDQFKQTVMAIVDFILPVIESLAENQAFTKTWKAPGPWK